ncbi:FAD-dependent oxidoreductase, partial [Arthrospira platensis SPKY1]|nr:FAD-dependent oxidoreductase [Arthrospira platensis SPKY1]
MPEITDKIVLSTPIAEVDYSADKVRLKASDGSTYEGDRVLITVPIKILQNESIRFVPALPAAKSEAINSIYMGDGIKIFVEFKERFYPDLVG